MRRCERERANAVADLARFAPTGGSTPKGGGVTVSGVMGHGSQQLAHQLVVALQEVDEKDGLCKEMERQLLHTQVPINTIQSYMMVLASNAILIINSILINLQPGSPFTGILLNSLSKV